MTDDEVGQFLGGRRTMNIGSLGPGGQIHLVAMWYGFLDGSDTFRPDAGYHDADIVIETFAKSQKVQNFRRDPRFTALYRSILRSLFDRGVRKTFADLDRYAAPAQTGQVPPVPHRKAP